MLRLDVCSVTIPSATGSTVTTAAGGGLASTGLSNVVAVLIVAAILLLTGTIILVVRSRSNPLSPALRGSRDHHGAGTLLGLLLVALVAGGVALTPEPASAATAPVSCELFTIGDVLRDTSSGAGVLPGGTVEPLAFTITNTTQFAIEVTVDTTVTSDFASAASLYLTSLLDESSAVLATGPLDAVPSTESITIGAGADLEVHYSLTLDLAATNAVQGASVVFDSLISASSISASSE